MSNDTLKIEKGIPIPERKAKETPYKSMDVGDSIVIKKTTRGAIGFWKAQTGFTFVTRAISDTEVRVWRTA